MIVDQKQGNIPPMNAVVRAITGGKGFPMSIVLEASASPVYDLSDEKAWTDIINLLRPYVQRLVYSAHVIRWRGQEEDIVEDILQETARRMIEYSRRAEQGAVLPISAPERLSVTIARNYCRDIQQRERRFLDLHTDSYASVSFARDYEMSPLDIAIEHVYQERIFAQLAHEIVRLPPKQRRALLIDLANRMDFNTQLTPLQKAFLTEGIDLKAYRIPHSTNATERARYASLLSLAYRRVGACMRESASWSS